jgi:hypothetical protein
MSLKVKRIIEIPLTTGGTTSIDSGELSLALLTSLHDLSNMGDTHYMITGTETLLSNYILTFSGNLFKGMFIRIDWKAVCTPSGNTVTICGEVIPSTYLSKLFYLECYYNGSSWEVNMFIDTAQTNVINGSSVIDATIGNAKISALAASKLTGTVSDAQIAAMNANKLTGSIDPARYANNTIPAAAIANSSLTATQMADGAVTLAKIASTGTLHVDATGAATTAVITEETLGSYSLPANLVASTGKGIRVKGAFTFDATANTKTARLKVNGQTIYSSATAVPTDTAPNNGRLLFEFDLIRTGATTGKVMGASHMTVSTTTTTAPGIGAVTSLDWTAIQPILWTGQNGTAAANDIVFELGSVEIIL